MGEIMTTIEVSYDYDELAEEVAKYYNDYEILECQYSVAIDQSFGGYDALFTAMIVYK